MTSRLLTDLAKPYQKGLPELKPGFTVRVHELIKEGEKERTQIFEGLIIAIHMGHTPTDRTFTVRRIASGIGVERIFAFHSPMLEKIEVKKVAKVRRAKLSFLRGRKGKAARMSERFTGADEFAVAIAPAVEAPAVEVATEAAPTEAVKEEKTETK
jgi:large subunit ribosomal protein L19